MNSPSLHKENLFLGIFYMLIAVLSYAVMSLIGKIIGDRAPTEVILFARFIISLILILPFVLVDPKHMLKITSPIKLILRSVFTFLSFALFFFSLKYLPLADAMLLNNTTPIFVPFVASFLIGTKTPRKIWSGIIVGFIGIGLVLHLTPKFFNPFSIVALISGMCSAMAVVIIRTLTRNTSMVQILFYNFLICTLFSAPLLLIRWQSLDRATLLLLLYVGLLGASYQFFSTLSFAKAPVRLTSPLMFLGIVFGVLADYFLWHNVPGTQKIIGMILVIVGGILTIYFGQRAGLGQKRVDPFK